MKAAVHTKYGPPEVVQLMDVPNPIPTNDEVLLKVYASTVNRTDCGFRSAEYFISRFWSGLFKPKHQILGCEFAGIIEEIGSDVSTFKVGDRVFGYNDKEFGGHAEYLTCKENGALAVIPNGMSFTEAAALTEGSHYALSNIRASKIKEGEFALVYGATGAIGSAAVQLLKALGVHVTAVCNSKNVELVRSLGADCVIDYQTQDYTKSEQLYNVIFDAVGKSSFRICKPLLTQKGIYISTELGKNGANVFLALCTPLFKGKKVLFPIPSISMEIVNYIKSLAEEGKFTPVIDRIDNLENIIEVYHYVESGQKTGNVVLQIQEEK